MDYWPECGQNPPNVGLTLVNGAVTGGNLTNNPASYDMRSGAVSTLLGEREFGCWAWMRFGFQLSVTKSSRL